LTLRIQDLENSDVPKVLEIVRTVMPERVEYVLTAIRRSEVLVSRGDAALTGFVVWNRQFFGKPFCWLLAVAPTYRRQGIASGLLGAVENRCSGERVYVSTNVSNVPMRRLLERCGYVRRGEVDVDQGDPEIFFSKG